MPNYSQENKIVLAIEAIHLSRNKFNQRCATAMYNIPQQTFNNQMKNVLQHKKTYIKQYKLNPIKKQILLQYAFNQDAKKFPLCFINLEDIINLLLKSQNGQPVNKH